MKNLSTPETYHSSPVLSRRSLAAAKLAGIGLLANTLSGCGYLTKEDVSPEPEPHTYTIARFIEERDDDKCPLGEVLKFSDIGMAGPDARGIYTMAQDGSPSMNVTVTFDPPALDVAHMNTITANVEPGCVLKMVNGQ